MEQYLPSCKQKYLFNNYRQLSSYRMYKANIPAYLHDRPRSVVIHCLNRMTKVNRYTIQDTMEGDGIFEVLKDTGSKQTVNFGLAVEDKMPSCTCMDWQRYHIPCKHFFAVFHHRPNWQWECLPAAYLQGPYLSMDTTVLSTHAISQGTNGTDGTDVARACTPTLSTQQASLNLTGFETGYADPLRSRSTRCEAGQRL